MKGILYEIPSFDFDNKDYDKMIDTVNSLSENILGENEFKKLDHYAIESLFTLEDANKIIENVNKLLTKLKMKPIKEYKRYDRFEYYELMQILVNINTKYSDFLSAEKWNEMKKWTIEFDKDQTVRIGDNDMIVKQGDKLTLTCEDEKPEMPDEIPDGWDERWMG